MMKKLGLLLILSSLGFSNNLIDDVITKNGVQYYSRPYVEEIIDATVAESFSNNVDKINDLKSSLLEMQLEQMSQISNIKRSYEREISILKQSHQLELKAEKLKGQMRYLQSSGRSSADI